MRQSLAILLLCGMAAPALAQDVSAARDASAKFTAALGRADAATAASFFAEDAVVLPPGRPLLTGGPQIQRFLGNMTRFAKNLKYVTEDLKPIDATTAREVGSFSFTMAKGNGQEVSGKYLLVWTKAGGDWKISADMWNRSQAGGRQRAGGRPGGQPGAMKPPAGGAMPGGATPGGAMPNDEGDEQ